MAVSFGCTGHRQAQTRENTMPVMVDLVSEALAVETKNSMDWGAPESTSDGFDSHRRSRELPTGER